MTHQTFCNITDYVIRAADGRFVVWSDADRWHLAELNSTADGADDFDTRESARSIAQMLANALQQDMTVCTRAW